MARYRGMAHNAPANRRYTERLAEEGAVTSVGSRGDSYDNALAETSFELTGSSQEATRDERR